MTAAQHRLIAMTSNTIVEACREAGPMGATSEVIQSAIRTHGWSQSAFKQIMAWLVQTGKVTRDGDFFRPA